MKCTVQNNYVTRRCRNVNLSKLVQIVFSVGCCEILSCIWALSDRRKCAVCSEVGSKMLWRPYCHRMSKARWGTWCLCLVFRLMSITNVQTELHEHFYGDKSSVWASVAGRISYKSLVNPLNAELNPMCCLLAFLVAHHFLHVSRIRVKHKMTVCGIYEYDNPNVFRTYLCVALCNIKQLDALFILSIFRHSTSTCFGHICSPSSGGILYIYSIPPDDGLRICPKHVEVEWRNKLGINSASSWFSLHRCIEMHGQQNIKYYLFTFMHINLWELILFKVLKVPVMVFCRVVQVLDAR